MSWEQDVYDFANTHIQPPTPSVTSRPTPVPSAEVQSSETPRSGLASFESFFPFSASPLQALCNSYDQPSPHNTSPQTSAELTNPTPASTLSKDVNADLVPSEAGKAFGETTAIPPNPALSVEVPKGNVFSPDVSPNSYGPTSATSARSVGSIHTAPPTSRSKAKRRKHVEQPDDLGEASAFARGFEHDNDQSQHALRHVQFAPDLLEAFGYSATAPTHLGQDMFWDPNASFVETEPTLQRLAEEDAIGSVEVNDDINQTWHSSRSRNMVSGASKAYDRIPPSSNKSKESASSLRQKGGTIREHRSASASVSGSHSYSHKRSSSLRTHENIGVIDPNYLSSSPVKLTETEGAAASIGHGSRWNVKDAQLRSTTEVLPAGSKREKVSRDARRERQTLKPRSNNGADMSFTESVAGLRPGIKRRHTDDNPSFSHSREARPAYIHGGGPQSTQRAPPTRRGRQAGRMGSIQETVDSASQTTVTFTIDENGRARAERKPVMDAGRRSAMVADAEDESEGDSDVSTTDDFAIATSRNTSFTVLGEPQNFASDGRSTGTSAHGRQRLSLQLEDEQYASCRSAAASLPSYVREGRSGRWSGHDPQRSLSRHRQANANVTSFGQDSFVEGETESEAETIVDEPAEKAPTRSSGQLSGQSSRRGGRRGKGR